MLYHYFANDIAGILVQLKTTLVFSGDNYGTARSRTSIVASPIHFLFQQYQVWLVTFR